MTNREFKLKKRMRRVMDALWEGRIAEISPHSEGLVNVDDEVVCRLSVIGDLLRMGLIEVAGPLAWRAKRCPICGGETIPEFECCENVYA